MASLCFSVPLLCLHTDLPSVKPGSTECLSPETLQDRRKATIWEISLGKKGQTWQQTLNALCFLPNGQLWRGIKETHYCPTRLFNCDFSVPFDLLLAAGEILLSPSGYCVGDIAVTRNGTRIVSVGTVGSRWRHVLVYSSLLRPKMKCLWNGLVEPRFLWELGISRLTANGKCTVMNIFESHKLLPLFANLPVKDSLLCKSLIWFLINHCIRTSTDLYCGQSATFITSVAETHKDIYSGKHLCQVTYKYQFHTAKPQLKFVLRKLCQARNAPA